MAEQYFSAEPSSKDVRRTLNVTLQGHDAQVQVSNGVFSGSRVDLGTSVLLKHAPEPPVSGNVLDLGCGWGPIALALAFASPEANVWAVDVNERALELTHVTPRPMAAAIFTPHRWMKPAPHCQPTARAHIASRFPATSHSMRYGRTPRFASARRPCIRCSWPGCPNSRWEERLIWWCKRTLAPTR